MTTTGRPIGALRQRRLLLLLLIATVTVATVHVDATAANALLDRRATVL